MTKNLHYAIVGAIGSLTVAAVYLITRLTPPPPKIRQFKKNLPGVRNIGNTCFISSTMQALSACSVVQRWLQTILQHSYATKQLLVYELSCALNVLNNKSVESHENYSPHSLLQCLARRGWVIPRGEQDAFEFFHVLVESLSEEHLASALASAPPVSLFHECLLSNHLFSNTGIKGRACDGLPRSPHQSTTTSSNPFKGRLNHQLTCKRCLRKTPARYDSFEGVSLHLPDKHGMVTLKEMLGRFVGVEEVSEMECVHCKRKGDFYKKTSFAKLPSILCLQMQRTVWTLDGPVKRGEHVCFPDLLDMSAYLSVCNNGGAATAAARGGGVRGGVSMVERFKMKVVSGKGGGDGGCGGGGGGGGEDDPVSMQQSDANLSSNKENTVLNGRTESCNVTSNTDDEHQKSNIQSNKSNEKCNKKSTDNNNINNCNISTNNCTNTTNNDNHFNNDNYTNSNNNCNNNNYTNNTSKTSQFNNSHRLYGGNVARNRVQEKSFSLHRAPSSTPSTYRVSMWKALNFYSQVTHAGLQDFAEDRGGGGGGGGRGGGSGGSGGGEVGGVSGGGGQEDGSSGGNDNDVAGSEKTSRGDLSLNIQTANHSNKNSEEIQPLNPNISHPTSHSSTKQPKQSTAHQSNNLSIPKCTPNHVIPQTDPSSGITTLNFGSAENKDAKYYPDKFFFSPGKNLAWQTTTAYKDLHSLVTAYNLDQTQSDHSYRLMALIVHLGTVDSGHFIAYKRATSRLGVRFPNRWYLASDEMVKAVPADQVFSAPAYMLLYEKI